MTLEYLINTYGYAAILIGTFFEGETVLVLGGAAARLSYLELQWVIICAFIGTFVGDNLFFILGRFKGQKIITRWPTWHERADNVMVMLEKRRVLVILGFRFVYGIRTVTPFVLGMSRVPIAEFMLLNAISAVVWACLFGAMGYLFGTSLEIILGDIRNYEVVILSAILFVGVLLWLIKAVRRK